MKNKLPQRVAAVDVFRALTMTLMLFVNDIPGLKNIPHWLEHAAMTEDMLGFSDTIFPAFLFCMGMSVSLAIQNRYNNGDSLLQVIVHVFWRTVALVAMGLFTVNCSGVAGLSQQIFSLVMVVGFFLVWGVYPQTKDCKKYLFIGMKAVGIALLAFLVIYKAMNGDPFQQKWWGILGLIGWTYAVCAIVYLFTRESLMWNSIVCGVFIILSLLNHAEVLPLPFIPSDMTLHAFGMAGVVTSLLMQKYAHKEHPRKFIGILFALGILLLTTAFICHPVWIISKIQATPTWFFFCTAAFFPLFGLFYWLTDVKGKVGWFAIIKPAGTATLTCYVIPYVWYAVQQLAGIHYPALLGSGMPGLLKSVVFSLAVVWITALLIKAKVKLKV